MAETILLMILSASMPMIGIGGFLCSLASDDPLQADVFLMPTKEEFDPIFGSCIFRIYFP
jgi:hypothetical protein